MSFIGAQPPPRRVDNPSLRVPSHSRPNANGGRMRCRSPSASSEEGSEITDREDPFDELLGRVLSFTPFRAEAAESNNDDTLGSRHIFAAQHIKEGTSKKGKEVATTTAELVHVLESQYRGTAFHGGNHSAKLKTVHSPNGTQQPIFRWLHLQQTRLNLDEMSKNIHGLLHLSKDEISAFDVLFGMVRARVKMKWTARSHSVEQIDSQPIRVNIEGKNNSRGDYLRAKRALKWFCIPYLTLEKGSGLMSASTIDNFPIHNEAAPKGKYLHVAQIWCVILDSSLLVTCGRMSLADLRGDAVSIEPKPPIDPALMEGTIYVSYESVMWGFPLDTCPTWFSFATRFHEFWSPEGIGFYYMNGDQDLLVTKEEWPSIVAEARHSDRKVILELRTNCYPQPLAHGILQPLRIGKNVEKASEAAGSSIAKDSEHFNGDFHVFTWMDPVQSKNNKQLEVIENFILENTSHADRRAYAACDRSSCKEVHEYLAQLEKLGNDTLGPRYTRFIEEYEDRVDLYNTAGTVFNFFLPSYFDEEAPTIQIFWGAVKILVEMLWNSTVPDNETKDEQIARRSAEDAVRNRRQTDVRPVLEQLLEIARVIQVLQDILCDASDSDRRKILVSKHLVIAWPHLILALVRSSQGDTWGAHMDKVGTLLGRGIREIMKNLMTEDLLTSVIIQPMELLALIMQGRIASRERNLLETYRSYIKVLQSDITYKPDRSYQHDINRLDKEIRLISSVINDQERFIEVAEENRYTHNFKETQRARMEQERDRRSGAQGSRRGDIIEASKLSSTDPGGVAMLIINDCRKLLTRRRDEFSDLYPEIARLEFINTTDIEIIRDKQERAVYAFTMVTIIFLPLSTISSIFGMNTSDVRNMELGQWVYWATALPATLTVILFGLWWMGELQKFGRWLRIVLTVSRPRGDDIPAQSDYLYRLPPGRPQLYHNMFSRMPPAQAYAQIRPPLQPYPQMPPPPQPYSQPPHPRQLRSSKNKADG